MKNYLSFAGGSPRRFGEYSNQTWKDFVDALYEGGELKSKDIDVSKLYTNEYVDRMNAFDVDAIRKQAKSLN